VNIDDRQTMRNPVISIRSVNRLLLVSEGHIFDSKSMARIDERVIRMATLAEHLRNAFLLKALGDEHRSSHSTTPG
jgi:hypothetical protein